MEILTSKQFYGCDTDEEESIQNEQSRLINEIVNLNLPAIARISSNNSDEKIIFDLVAEEDLFSLISGDRIDCKNGVDFGYEDDLLIIVNYGSYCTRVGLNNLKNYEIIKHKVELKFIDNDTYNVLSKRIEDVDTIDKIDIILKEYFINYEENNISENNLNEDVKEKLFEFKEKLINNHNLVR